jgi:hypothetical protein
MRKKDAATLGRTTLSIMALSIMAFSIMALSTMALSTMALSIMALSMNDSECPYPECGIWYCCPEASSLNKSSFLAPALGATNFIIVTDMILVTLCCAT